MGCRRAIAGALALAASLACAGCADVHGSPVDAGEPLDAARDDARGASRADAGLDAPVVDAGVPCAAGDYRLEGSPVSWTRELPRTDAWWEEDAAGSLRLAWFAPDFESVVRSPAVGGVPFVAADGTVYAPHVLAVSPSGEVLSALTRDEAFASPTLYVVLHGLDGAPRSALVRVDLPWEDTFKAVWGLFGAWTGSGWSGLVAIQGIGRTSGVLVDFELDAAGRLVDVVGLDRSLAGFAHWVHYDEDRWRGLVVRSGPERTVDGRFELGATGVVSSPLSMSFTTAYDGAALAGVAWDVPHADDAPTLDHALRVDVRTGVVARLDLLPPLELGRVTSVRAAIEDPSTLAILITRLRSDDVPVYDVYRVRMGEGIVQRLSLPDALTSWSEGYIRRVEDRYLVLRDGQLDELVACE